MRRSSQDGYATPAAAIIALTVAVVVIAGLTRSMAELRLARSEFQKTRIEYALGAAHNLAVLSVASSGRPPPFHWTLTTLEQGFDVIAEPERTKLALAAADQLDDTLLDRLDVGDHEALRARLAALAEQPWLVWPAEASSRQRWRVCGPSLISFYGAGVETPAISYGPPEAGQNDSHWRAGEVWRFAVTDSEGWRDERIVRFTGNGLNPVAVIGRRLTRGWKDTPACDTLLDAV
mgnify:CR=1 FL=1